MKKINYFLFILISFNISHAAIGDTIRTFLGSIESLIGDALSGLFLTAATAAFFYNVFRFILARSSGGDAINDAKEKLMWSVIALTVAFSVWGIVQFLQVGFGFSGKTTIQSPTLNINPSAQPATSQPRATGPTVPARPAPGVVSGGNLSGNGTTGITASGDVVSQPVGADVTDPSSPPIFDNTGGYSDYCTKVGRVYHSSTDSCIDATP